MSLTANTNDRHQPDHHGGSERVGIQSDASPDRPVVNLKTFHKALLAAAADNTERAQAASLQPDLSEVDASLCAKNYAHAALSQIQAYVTISRAAAGGDSRRRA